LQDTRKSFFQNSDFTSVFDFHESVFDFPSSFTSKIKNHRSIFLNHPVEVKRCALCIVR